MPRVVVSLALLLSIMIAQPCYCSENQKFVIGAFSKSGFFALFFAAVGNIVWAKKNGRVPVIYWSDDTLYYQKGGYHGEQNVWEYYFEPVSHLSYQPGDEIYRDFKTPDNVLIPPGWNTAYGSETYATEFHKRQKFEWHEAIKKNITVKPWITAKVEEFYQGHMKGKPLIGIHLRGTDKRFEVNQVPTGAILEIARRLAVSMGNRPLFLVATDEERLLDLAKDKLGADRVIAYDSIRSRSGAPIHWLNQNNNGLQGEQVLIETLLLARCDFFIHTASNVATAVMLFNPYLKSTFLKYEQTRGIIIRTNP